MRCSTAAIQALAMHPRYAQREDIMAEAMVMSEALFNGKQLDCTFIINMPVEKAYTILEPKIPRLIKTQRPSGMWKIKDCRRISYGGVNTMTKRIIPYSIMLFVISIAIVPITTKGQRMETKKAEKTENMLEGVPTLDWGKGLFCFAGAVVGYLEFIEEPVPYEIVMGVSGGAWRLVWDEGKWAPDNLVLGWFGPKRTFKALGYEYSFIDNHRKAPKTEANSEEGMKAKIRSEIDAGRPVIAIGVVGPEDVLVAGYKEGGDVLLGQSYFHRPKDQYFEKRDWYKECIGMHIIGKKKEPPTMRDALIESLKGVLSIARTPKVVGYVNEWEAPNVNRRANGLAAYQAWARDMMRYEDFHRNDPKRLKYLCMSIGDNWDILLDARRAAQRYLEWMQFEVGEEAQQHLLAAAKLHGKEADIAQTFRNLVPRHHMSDEEILRKTEPENRKLLAKVILVCKDLYEQAINHIERALAAEEVEGEFPQRKRPSEEGEVVIQSPLPKEFVSSPLVI